MQKKEAERGELDASYGKNGILSQPCLLKMLGRKDKKKYVYMYFPRHK